MAKNNSLGWKLDYSDWDYDRLVKFVLDSEKKAKSLRTEGKKLSGMDRRDLADVLRALKWKVKPEDEPEYEKYIHNILEYDFKDKIYIKEILNILPLKEKPLKGSKEFFDEYGLWKKVSSQVDDLVSMDYQKDIINAFMEKLAFAKLKGLGFSQEAIDFVFWAIDKDVVYKMSEEEFAEVWEIMSGYPDKFTSKYEEGWNVKAIWYKKVDGKDVIAEDDFDTARARLKTLSEGVKLRIMPLQDLMKKFLTEPKFLDYSGSMWRKYDYYDAHRSEQQRLKDEQWEMHQANVRAQKERDQELWEAHQASRRHAESLIIDKGSNNIIKEYPSLTDRDSIEGLSPNTFGKLLDMLSPQQPWTGKVQRILDVTDPELKIYPRPIIDKAPDTYINEIRPTPLKDEKNILDSSHLKPVIVEEAEHSLGLAWKIEPVVLEEPDLRPSDFSKSSAPKVPRKK